MKVAKILLFQVKYHATKIDISFYLPLFTKIKLSNPEKTIKLGFEVVA